MLRICWRKNTDSRGSHPTRCSLVFQKRKSEGWLARSCQIIFQRGWNLASPFRRWRNIVPTARITTADGFKPRSPLVGNPKIAPRWILDGSRSSMKFSSTAPVVVRYGNKTKLRKNFRNGEVISNRKDISKNISRRLHKWRHSRHFV